MKDRSYIGWYGVALFWFLVGGYWTWVSPEPTIAIIGFVLAGCHAIWAIYRHARPARAPSRDGNENEQ